MAMQGRTISDSLIRECRDLRKKLDELREERSALIQERKDIATKFKATGRKPTPGQAVALFIAVFGSSLDIQARARALLEQLHRSPDWTDAEVGQVRGKLEAAEALAKAG